MNYEQGRKAIEAIMQLPLLGENDPGFQEQGEQIARLCGNYDTFQALDETPGVWAGYYDEARSGGQWHIKLRRARNSCDRFFDVLNEDRRPGNGVDADAWDRDLAERDEADRRKREE